MDSIPVGMKVGFDPPWIISGLLLIPYLLWGVYLLRLRLVHQEEVKPLVQLITLAAVLVYFSFQYRLLYAWMHPTPWQFFAAMGALIVSGVALYGHLVISLVSTILLAMVMPGGPGNLREPRYGAGEACERAGDFEGASREYLAMGRMFPKDSKSALRAADNLLKIGQPEEAAAEFERGLRNMNSPEQELAITMRLAQVYEKDLGKVEQAIETLENYLKKHPDSERAEAVRARIARLVERHEINRRQPPGSVPV